MSNRKACEDLQEAWNEVSTKWNAEAKSKYFNLIFLPLAQEADGMYLRNENLEAYAQDCINAVRS